MKKVLLSPFPLKRLIIAALEMSTFFGALHLPLHATGLPKIHK